MKRLLYRALLRLLPARRLELTAVRQTMPDAGREGFRKVLHRHMAMGGALAMFDAQGLTDHFVYGQARAGLAVDAGTAFRLASVSKLVTAAGVMAMREEGAVSLERDADLGLPYTLRHPAAPDTPVTLEMLLSHTAGIRDGKDYLRGLTGGQGADELLRGDSHTHHLPGRGSEYSNFGLGLAGCVVEAQTGLSFQQAMDRYLFSPLGMNASYYRQQLSGIVADAVRVLPPRSRPNYDGAKRQAAQFPGWDQPDPIRHHLLAHGGCCMDVISLVTLGQALLRPGFFGENTLNKMREPRADLSGRDPHLQQGIGLFILRDQDLCPDDLVGHQGMAYGAVHMLFLDVNKCRGIISLTTGCSEARRYILSDINRDLLAEWLRHG